MNNSNKASLSVLIPVYNEEKNLEACLSPLNDWAAEIVIVDSNSTDKTHEIAKSYGIDVIQFEYNGKWPKKRQWALDTYNFKGDWILLLDADEILLPKIKEEIETAILNPNINGYHILFQMEFLGKQLKWSYPGLRKLSLFRKGKGAYEMLLEHQDESMSPIEIHEHVIVEGKTENLKSPILHKNVNSLFRYIHKHNEYSNWESNVLLHGVDSDIKPKLFGSQAERRRWMKRKLINIPILPAFLMFMYLYFGKLGFLDGKPGLFYSLFQSINIINTQAKMYEIQIADKIY